MRGKNYSPEFRQEAEDLYVEEGLTYKEVAHWIQISEHVIKRWGRDDDWPELRKEYLQTNRELNRNLRKVRLNLMNKVVESDKPDPQDIYAMIRIENLAYQRERKTESAAPDIDRPRLFLENLEFVAETLKEIDPEGLKVLARNFETIVKRYKKLATDSHG